MEYARNLLWMREDGSLFKSPYICEGIVGAPAFPDLFSAQATEVERSVCNSVCVRRTEFPFGWLGSVIMIHLSYLLLRRVTSEQPPAISPPWGPTHPRPTQSHSRLLIANLNLILHISDDFPVTGDPWHRDSVHLSVQFLSIRVTARAYEDILVLTWPDSFSKSCHLSACYVNHPLVSFHAAWMQMTEVCAYVLFTCGWERACQAVESDSPNGLVTARIIDLDSYQLCNS